MTAKRSQMWPGRRGGWQRLGAAPRGGRADGWRGPAPGGPWGGQRASRTRSERAAAGRAGPVGEVIDRGLLGWLWGWEPREAWFVGWGCRVGIRGEEKAWEEREERGDPPG